MRTFSKSSIGLASFPKLEGQYFIVLINLTCEPRLAKLLFDSILPQYLNPVFSTLKVEFLWVEKTYQNQKSCAQYTKTKIGSVSVNFASYMRMMQMYFYNDNSMNSLE